MTHFRPVRSCIKRSLIFTHYASHISNFKLYQIENCVENSWNHSQCLCHIPLKITFLLTTQTYFSKLFQYCVTCCSIDKSIISLCYVISGQRVQRLRTRKVNVQRVIFLLDLLAFLVLTGLNGVSVMCWRHPQRTSDLSQIWLRFRDDGKQHENERTLLTHAQHADRAAIFVLLIKH